MFLGLGFGVIMAIGYAFALLCPSSHDMVMEAWLASLTPAERKTWDYHEKRKKEWIALRKKQHKICMKLRQKQYDTTGWDHYWQCLGEAAEQVGINAYKDVWAAKDCPVVRWDGNWPLNYWRTPPPTPHGVTDDWKAGLGNGGSVGH
jgi:hypothetical protein